MAKIRGRGGIPDWEQKKEVLKELLPAYTDHDIFQKVVEGSGTAHASEVSRLADASRNWGDHTPLKEGEFFDRLVTKLSCKPGTSGVSFLNTSIAEFIEMLPEVVRDNARRVAGLKDTTTVKTGPPSSAIATPFSPRVVYLHHTDEMYSMAAGVRDGNLDTRHYYSTADAAETWKHLTSSVNYPTYDQCKWGLRELVATNVWKNALEAASPSAAVMLGGGGSPSKDLVVARSLLDHAAANARLTMILVDINPYMLIQSENYLRREKQNLPNHERIEFQYAAADILKLGTTREPIFIRNGSAVFAITGGTIGNLSEANFFRSLNQVGETGDLLIVSADTVDGIPPEQLKAQLALKYNHEDMQRMIRPGVVAVLSELHIQEPVDSALKRVKVDVTPNSEAKLSDVPGSCNVTLNLMAGDRKVTLVRSTRYVGDSLIRFAARFNWESICSVPSPLNPHFVQFAFRRK